MRCRSAVRSATWAASSAAATASEPLPGASAPAAGPGAPSAGAAPAGSSAGARTSPGAGSIRRRSRTTTRSPSPFSARLARLSGVVTPPPCSRPSALFPAALCSLVSSHARSLLVLLLVDDLSVHDVVGLLLGLLTTVGTRGGTSSALLLVQRGAHLLGLGG